MLYGNKGRDLHYIKPHENRQLGNRQRLLGFLQRKRQQHRLVSYWTPENLPWRTPISPLQTCSIIYTAHRSTCYLASSGIINCISGFQSCVVFPLYLYILKMQHLYPAIATTEKDLDINTKMWKLAHTSSVSQ